VPYLRSHALDDGRQHNRHLSLDVANPEDVTGNECRTDARVAKTTTVAHRSFGVHPFCPVNYATPAKPTFAVYLYPFSSPTVVKVSHGTCSYASAV
jgi:hypothetical protein